MVGDALDVHDRKQIAPIYHWNAVVTIDSFLLNIEFLPPPTETGKSITKGGQSYSNGNEALSDEFLLKSNGVEVLNDGFPYKLTAVKRLTLSKKLGR